MEKRKLDIIVKHFTEVYDEEIRNNEVTGDCINEWWWYTRDKYGYDSDEASEVYPEIEKAIFKAIMKNLAQ